MTRTHTRKVADKILVWLRWRRDRIKREIEKLDRKIALLKKREIHEQED